MARRMLGKSTSNYLERTTSVPVTAFPLSIYFKAKLYSLDSIQDAVYYGKDDGTGYWVFYLNSTNGSSVTAGAVNFASGTGGADASAVPSGRVVAGEWFDVMGVVRSATDRWCYLNYGGLTTAAQSTTNRNVTGTFELDVFGFHSGVDLYGPGDLGIANLTIWRSALYHGEFLAIAQGAPPHTIRPEDVRAQYFLDGDSPTPTAVVNETNRMFSRTGYTPYDLSVTGTLLGEARPVSGSEHDWYGRRRFWTVSDGGGGVSTNPSPVAADTNVVAVTSSLSQALTAIGRTVGVVVPATTLSTPAQTPVTSAFGVVGVGVSLGAPAGPVVVAGGVVTPTSTLSQAATPVTAALSVPAVTAGRAESVNPIAADTNVLAVTTSLGQAPASVVTDTNVVTPGSTLSGSVTPVAADTNVTAPATSLGHAVSPPAADTNVPAVTSTLSQALSPVTAVFSVPDTTETTGAVTNPDPVTAASGAVAPATTLAQTPVDTPATFLALVPHQLLPQVHIAVELDAPVGAATAAFGVMATTLNLSQILSPVSAAFSVPAVTLDGIVDLPDPGDVRFGVVYDSSNLPDPGDVRFGVVYG